MALQTIHHPEDVQVEIISTVERFLALEQEWNRLADVTDPTNFFLRHEWFRSAWAWLRSSHRLHILRLSCGSRAVGILPLVCQDGRWRFGKTAVLLAMTIPDTQSFDLLCSAQDTEPVAMAIATHLAATRSLWDVLRLEKLLDTQKLSRLRSALAASGLASRVDLADTCLTVPLADSWDSYYGRRSRRLKKGNNLIANRLQRDFKSIEVSFEGPPAAEQAAEFQDAAVQTSAKSWKVKTGLTLDNLDPGAWWKELNSASHGMGVLKVWTLKLDGAVAATEIQLHFGEVVAALRADIDRNFETYSPGTYLNWKVLQALFGGQNRVYNMGPGGNEYKKRWAEDVVQLYSLHGYSRSLRGAWLSILEKKLAPAVSAVRRRLAKRSTAQRSEFQASLESST